MLICHNIDMTLSIKYCVVAGCRARAFQQLNTESTRLQMWSRSSCFKMKVDVFKAYLIYRANVHRDAAAPYHT